MNPFQNKILRRIFYYIKNAGCIESIKIHLGCKEDSAIVSIQSDISSKN